MTRSQKSGNLSKPNWNAVQSLLDDESEVVRAGLLKFLEEVPDEGREFWLDCLREKIPIWLNRLKI